MNKTVIERDRDRKEASPLTRTIRGRIGKGCEVLKMRG